MSELYNRIYQLCQERGISIGRMCNELGISRGNLTELKMDRIKTLKVENLTKISSFFNISIDRLLGYPDLSGKTMSFQPIGEQDRESNPWLATGQKEKAPTSEGGRQISDDEIKFALFGGDGEITDAMFDEVRNFAAFVKSREQEKKKE